MAGLKHEHGRWKYLGISAVVVPTVVEGSAFGFFARSSAIHAT